ncbi:Hypothetical protein FKW44_023835 [Caligus rogercresseyi]|uniref:Uncharacterized protein n=1 Tax=Caligus rogercresseyi TaxID=217165 RepID=A0A7T8GPX8_CALRO|nr:Hypothetical protein FKW44_023835 [Caligus rogercresseyi]
MGPRVPPNTFGVKNTANGPQVPPNTIGCLGYNPPTIRVPPNTIWGYKSSANGTSGSAEHNYIF